MDIERLLEDKKKIDEFLHWIFTSSLRYRFKTVTRPYRSLISYLTSNEGDIWKDALGPILRHRMYTEYKFNKLSGEELWKLKRIR